jgi:hypothetical protein
MSEQDQAIFSLFMARLVHVLLTALLHDDHKILETEVAKRYVGSLRSILISPGGVYWLQEMGGDDQLNDWAREVLARTDDSQSFLTYGSSGSGHKPE